MTPQVARIDAHVRPVEGVARYCYSGLYYILNHKISCTRAPLQLGAELYGHDSIEADVEMVDVMLGLIENIYTLQGAHLDLGHVGLFRSLVKCAGLSK